MQKNKSNGNRGAIILVIIMAIAALLLLSGLYVAQKVSDIRATTNAALIEGK